MECQLCSVRSSDGFCVICQRMACDECSHVCKKCGKRTCVDHGYTHKSGRWVCANCLEKHGAPPPKGAAAPDLAGAPKGAPKEAAAAPPHPGVAPEQELVFEEPPAVPRMEVEPWKAGITVGIIAIVAAGVFGLLWKDLPWPILLVAGLGVVWSSIGLAGRHKRKGLAATALVMNILPFALAAGIGVTGWQKQVEVVDPMEGVSEAEQIRLRQRQQQKIIEELRRARSGGPAPARPAPSAPPPAASQ
jgi:hypothetical protein